MRIRHALNWWNTGNDDDDAHQGSSGVEIDDDGTIVDKTDDK